MEKIIILMATYNGENFIEEQLDSVLDQSFTDFSLFAGDDGSTDGTRKILERYKEKLSDRVNLFYNEYPVGVRKNFLNLLSSALDKAEYFMFCDQDDVWDKDKIKLTLKTMKVMEKRYGKKTPLLVYTDLSICDEKLTVISPSMRKASGFDNINSLARLLVENKVTGNTVMINSALARLALRTPVEELAQNIEVHDRYLALLACCTGRTAYIDIPLVRYRQHSKNLLGAKKSFLKETLLSFKKENKEKVKNSYRLMYAQARQVLKLTENERKKDVLKAFISMEGASGIYKIITCIRWGFFKSDRLLSLSLMFRI
jgi:glycosyltransferase, family 2